MKYHAERLRNDLIMFRVIEKRLSMEKAAKEIGISKATLSRLENNSIPDMETFVKVCNWLNKAASQYIH